MIDIDHPTPQIWVKLKVLEINKPQISDEIKRWFTTRREGVVVQTLASRPKGPGSIPDLTGHYYHAAAVGMLLTLNCLSIGLKQWCMQSANIG